MPFVTRHIEEKKLVIHIGHGLITQADILGQLTACFGDGWTRNSLWDLREASLAALSTNDVRALAQSAVTLARKDTGVKNAWVAVADADYGLCRMSEMLADGAGLSLAVFHDYGEAVRWVTTP